MSNHALREIITRAKQIRGADKSKGSWKAAVFTASEEYRRAHNTVRKSRSSVVNKIRNNEELYALYQGFTQQRRALIEKYYKAGLTFLHPKKHSQSKPSARKRLPPILLGRGPVSRSHVEMEVVDSESIPDVDDIFLSDVEEEDEELDPLLTLKKRVRRT